MRLVYNVHPGYLSILRQLWLTDNITQKELPEQILVEQATLSNTLKRNGKRWLDLSDFEAR